MIYTESSLLKTEAYFETSFVSPEIPLEKENHKMAFQ